MYRVVSFLVMMTMWAPSSSLAQNPTPSPSATSSPTATYTGPGAACLPESSPATQCVKSASRGASLTWSDACLTCQEKMNYDGANGIRKASCEALRSVVETELRNCQAECFPTDYECSDLEFKSTACFFTDIFNAKCAENGSSGNGATSEGVAGRQGRLGYALLALWSTWIGSWLI